MTSRKGGGLSDAERDALLTHVVARGGVKRPAAAEQPKERRAGEFSALPGYRELIMQRTLGSALGFEDPFYRLHEGRAGPETRIGGKTFLNIERPILDPMAAHQVRALEDNCRDFGVPLHGWGDADQGIAGDEGDEVGLAEPLGAGGTLR